MLLDILCNIFSNCKYYQESSGEKFVWQSFSIIDIVKLVIPCRVLQISQNRRLHIELLNLFKSENEHSPPATLPPPAPPLPFIAKDRVLGFEFLCSIPGQLEDVPWSRAARVIQ